MNLASKLAVASVVLASAAAYGASRSQTECEAAGGTFFQDGSERGCIYPVVTTWTSGKEGKGQPIEEQDTTSGKGNLTNKDKKDYVEDDTCDGPGKSGESSDHCA